MLAKTRVLARLAIALNCVTLTVWVMKLMARNKKNLQARHSCRVTRGRAAPATRKGFPPAGAVRQPRGPVHNDGPQHGVDGRVWQPQERGGQHVAGHREEQVVPLLPENTQLVDLQQGRLLASPLAVSHWLLCGRASVAHADGELREAAYKECESSIQKAGKQGAENKKRGSRSASLGDDPASHTSLRQPGEFAAHPRPSTQKPLAYMK